jgi:hypothetical protein
MSMKNRLIAIAAISTLGGPPQTLAASATLSAVVNGTANTTGTGLLVRGAGAVSAAFAGDGTRGTYEVIFDRNVTGCTYSATVGGLATDVQEPGFITVTGRGGKPNGVFVATRNQDLTSGKRRFHLIVVC